MSFTKISNKIIEWDILFLIVFTPIAFGAVEPWAYTLMEFTIFILIIIWIVRLWIINLKKTSIILGRRGLEPISQIRNLKFKIPNLNSKINRFGFIKMPLNIPIMLFVVSILLQLTPLPPGVLKFLSPNTYQFYKTTSPGWPDRGNASSIQYQESSINNT